MKMKRFFCTEHLKIAASEGKQPACSCRVKWLRKRSIPLKKEE
jgi:hypothetical protein